MEVGVELLRVVGVVEDHADAAGVLDRLALVDAGIGAPLTEHDLAGDLRWVERAGEAQLRMGRVGGGESGVHRVDQRRGANAGTPADAV